MPSLQPSELIEKIERESQLNEKQRFAFRIITDHFIQTHVRKEPKQVNQLSMLMTGPGGTGKAHVVRAVQRVMEHYSCGHLIRFLAPTGSAAALIEGMTVHKALGIKINSEDYTVLISVRERSKLREEWKNVEYILLDETSLLGLELLAEIDHSL
ncbi:hypothetical protein L210DRAFT_3420682, partial [Boletus edulis BED1]